MNARDRNRATFSAGAELMDVANAVFPCSPDKQGHRITYAESFDTGERVGKPDTNTYVENILGLLDRARELPHALARK